MKANEKDINEYLEKATDYLSHIYNAFFLYKSMYNSSSIYIDVFNSYKYFWQVVICSLQGYWLLEISKLFFKPKKDQEVISLYSLLEFVPEGEKKEEIREEINKNLPFVKNLRKWRHKLIAHHDKYVVFNTRDFCLECSISLKKVEELLKSMESILYMIKSETTDDPSAISFTYLINESKNDLEVMLDRLGKK